jgi:septal ring factor EnvC (AmiA/AmiB activator)
MNLNAYFLPSMLVITLLILIAHQYFMKKIKKKSERHLSSIRKEIKKEHTSWEKAKIKANELQELTDRNQQKIHYIKLEILHIHFSLKEICKFI